ncbi:IS630 family transposase [Methylovulum miyakonense]|uniref:IS630 family transposase n=1 Tax=Methylovulum miyakonense TaxID=645578 RepID=UPI001E3211C5|nr:IS630 family transposase [Methylovulum miyakonense]
MGRRTAPNQAGPSPSGGPDPEKVGDRDVKAHFKKTGYSWRRCRRSVKSRRCAEGFAKAKDIQTALKKWDDEDKISLFYFDESGFSTASSVPYAWQPKGQTLEIPCFHSQRLNVLGFVSRDSRSFFHTVEGRVKTEQVAGAFDLFAAHYGDGYAVHKKPCVVIIDNASMHTSRAFLARRDDWMAQGVVLHYLPPYSPELNLIEIVWRKIKYEWLPLSCYASYGTLKQAVLDILSKFGDEYRVTFV